MKVNVLRSKYEGVSSVVRHNALIGTMLFPDKDSLENPNFMIEDEVNVLVYDYTPVRSGNILIKHPNKPWEKLKMNSKIFNQIKKHTEYRKPHAMRRSNWLASIMSTYIDSIDIL